MRNNPFPYIKCETCKYASVDHSLSGYHLYCRINKETRCGDIMRKHRKVKCSYEGSHSVSILAYPVVHLLAYGVMMEMQCQYSYSGMCQEKSCHHYDIHKKSASCDLTGDRFTGEKYSCPACDSLESLTEFIKEEEFAPAPGLGG